MTDSKIIAKQLRELRAEPVASTHKINPDTLRCDVCFRYAFECTAAVCEPDKVWRWS